MDGNLSKFLRRVSEMKMKELTKLFSDVILVYSGEQKFAKT